MSDQTTETNPFKSFTNILALTVSLICLLFLFVAAFFLSKTDVKDNTMLSQITTGVLSILMLILAYFFGSSSGSARQAAQITEMQKTATEAALGTNTSAVTEMKVDKAVKIEQLKAELAKLEPDSEDAKTKLAELEQLEKNS